MRKINLVLATLLLSLGTISAIPNIASAYKGDPQTKGPNYSTERHELMLKAFENNDYEAWSNLMQNRGRVTQIINKENFAKFAEAHRLTLQGKMTEAQKIRRELGLGTHDGSGKGRWGK